MAYKDINMVMASQKNLVSVVAKFTPKMVRMAEQGRLKKRNIKPTVTL